MDAKSGYFLSGDATRSSPVRSVKGKERRKFQIWYQAQHPIEHYSQIHKIQCGERIGENTSPSPKMKMASKTQTNLGNFACIKHFVTFLCHGAVITARLQLRESTFVLKRVEIIAIRIKRTYMHFLRNVSPLTPSWHLKFLLEELTPGGKKLLPVTVLDASEAFAYSL